MGKTKKKTQEIQQAKPYNVSKNRIPTNSGASVELITTGNCLVITTKS